MAGTLQCRSSWRPGFFLLVSGVLAGAAAAPDSGAAAVLTPGGPEARLAAARAAPCSLAVRIFQELSADGAAPDSVRQRASCSRADIALAVREYETARDYYKQAAVFEKVPGRCRYLSGVAALANGDTAEALAVFSAVIDSGEKPFLQEAGVQKAELLLLQKDFQGAMELFRGTGPFSFKNSWSIHALLGKLECARRLGLADSAAVYDKQLSSYRQTILEKERLRKIREIPLPHPQADTISGDSARTVAVVSAKDTVPADTIFALQVGAFGSKANAEALVKKLKPRYKEVSCVPTVVEESTFYRVWVGKFDTREAAERFGKGKLLREGYVFRVMIR